jgi:hypothetical protein
LRRKSGPKRKKRQEAEEDCIIRGFITCMLHQILLGSYNLKGRDHLEDQEYMGV